MIVMKKVLLFLLFLFFYYTSSSQFSHQIGINLPVHADFFNREKDNFNPVPAINTNVLYIPAINYRLEKNHHGVEIYMTYFYREYNKDIIMDNQILDINYGAFGLNYSYTFLDKKDLQLRGLGGINYGLTSHTVVLAAFSQDNSVFDAIVSTGRKWNFGLQAGLNVTVRVWRWLYANGNLRYTFHPNVQYREHRQNLLTEIGLGVTLQSNKSYKVLETFRR